MYNTGSNYFTCMKLPSQKKNNEEQLLFLSGDNLSLRKDMQAPTIGMELCICILALANVYVFGFR